MSSDQIKKFFQGEKMQKKNNVSSVADIFGLNASALRFWEKEGLMPISSATRKTITACRLYPPSKTSGRSYF